MSTNFGNSVAKTHTSMKMTTSKIPLLVFCGWGHSATTPFYYTVALDNKGFHGGHKKETGYLNELENYEYFNMPMWKYTSDPYERLLGKDDPLTPPSLNCHSPYTRHTEEFIRDWIAEPPSIQKYIDYYKIHYENIKDDYHGVSDFANGNSLLREPFLEKYIPILQEHFDVKCIFVARDPVRRSYSDFSAKFTCNDVSGERLKEGWLYPDNPTERQYTSIHEMFRGELHKSCTRFYVEFYRKFKKYVPTLQLVMEEFWEPSRFEEQTKKVSDFLGFPITKIHHNAFWPEAADKAPQYDYLKDQWGSVRDPLTPELYEYGRNVLFPVYKAWKDEFGVLPDTWGEFI